LQHSIFGDNEEHYLWFVAGLGAWSGWTAPFLTVRRKPVTSSSILQLTDTSRV
jgi:hypothetical protein